MNNQVTAPLALEIFQLSKYFGGLKAVSDLTFAVPQGSIFGLIGPNGAGKTTVFNLLTGVYQPTHGNINAFGQALEGKKCFEITRLGVARTFQNIRLFKDLTVMENVMVALDNNSQRKHSGLLSSILRTHRLLENELNQRKGAIELLEIFKLSSRRNVQAKSLPYGDQRKLEIARAIATGARLLLLDEPAAGLNPYETASLMETIRFIRTELNITVLLIEHDMKLVMGICEKIAVLDYGLKIAEDVPAMIQNNPKVIEAYLGKSVTDGK